jgi:hypothetical protein
VSYAVAQAECDGVLITVDKHAEYSLGDITDWNYTVSVDGVPRHEHCSAEEVIRALCHYIQGAKK